MRTTRLGGFVGSLVPALRKVAWAWSVLPVPGSPTWVLDMTADLAAELMGQFDYIGVDELSSFHNWDAWHAWHAWHAWRNQGWAALRVQLG